MGFSAFMQSAGGQAAMSGLSSAGADFRQAHFNRQVVRDARSYNDSVLSTMYQKTVGDMKKAGLNPALAYEAGGVSKASGGPGVPSGAIQKGGGMSLEGLSSANLTSAQAGKIREETRDIKATADRNEVISDVLKKIGPRLEQGIGAVESSAAAAGSAAARVEEWVTAALKKVGDLKLPTGADFRAMVEEIVNSFIGARRVGMPPAVKDMESILKMYAPGARGTQSGAWGKSEYERAQEERRSRARQSPASRSRGK